MKNNPEYCEKTSKKIVSVYMSNPNLSVESIAQILGLSKRKCNIAITKHLKKITKNKKIKDRPQNKSGLFKVPKSKNENDYSSFNGIRNVKWTEKTFNLTSDYYCISDAKKNPQILNKYLKAKT